MGELRELVERVWDAIELDDLDRLDDVCDAHCTWTMPGIGFSNLAAAKQALVMWTQAFPDIRHEVVDYVEADDKIAVELFVTALHTGPLVTPTDEVPPTWRPVAIESTDVVTVRDGKIVSWHSYFDMASLMAQVAPVRVLTAAAAR